MDRWVGKVAIVTGASSGIGAATVIALVKSKVIVVGLARRQERVEQLKNEVPEELKDNLHAIKCDVSKEDEILAAFKFVEDKLGGVDILINNAGIIRSTLLLAAGNSTPLREIVDTNVMGLVHCSREAVLSMKKREVDGHIIHINSIAGHKVPMVLNMALNIYPASKHAVTALTESMRQELIMEKSKIKVTSISPGAVRTEIVGEEMAANMEFPFLESEDIANSILYVLGTPPHVQIHEIMIKPIGETI